MKINGIEDDTMKIKSKIANVANIEFMKAVVERFDSPHVMLEQDYKADWGVYYIGEERLRSLTLQNFLVLMLTMNNELEAFNKALNIPESLWPEDIFYSESIPDMLKKDFP